MIMWIVLGSLIGVVVLFLVITSFIDRKKNAKLKIQKVEMVKDVDAAGEKIARQVNEVIERNNDFLKQFVPSIGQLKMSDINNEARSSLRKIKSSRDFQLLQHVDKRQEEFDVHINALFKEKSNNWAKRNQADLKFFKTYKKPVVKKPAPKKKTSKKRVSKKPAPKKSVSKKENK